VRGASLIAMLLEPGFTASEPRPAALMKGNESLHQCKKQKILHRAPCRSAGLSGAASNRPATTSQSLMTDFDVKTMPWAFGKQS